MAKAYQCDICKQVLVGVSPNWQSGVEKMDRFDNHIFNLLLEATSLSPRLEFCPDCLIKLLDQIVERWRSHLKGGYA